MSARIQQIANVVAGGGQGGSFPCHKTVDRDGDDEDDRRNYFKERQCAGAVIFMYKTDGTSNLARVMERMGGIDRELAEGDHSEIFDDLDEMLETALDRRPSRRR